MSFPTQPQTGLFGKLPTYGDFLSRDLSNAFVEVWDAWLQGFISSGQEQLGEHWLDIYLTSPIWRFAFSPGVIDGQTWVGILVPSVDRVGRYFPFSIARPVQTDQATTVISDIAQGWYQHIEDITLHALDAQIMIEELLQEINAVALDCSGQFVAQESAFSSMGTIVRAPTEQAKPSQVFAQLLDSTLKQLHTSYSVWNTLGSQYVEPCAFVCKSMPPMGGIAAMLDGDWAQSQWCEPYYPEYVTSAEDHPLPKYPDGEAVQAPAPMIDEPFAVESFNASTAVPSSDSVTSNPIGADPFDAALGEHSLDANRPLFVASAPLSSADLTPGEVRAQDSQLPTGTETVNDVIGEDFLDSDDTIPPEFIAPSALAPEFVDDIPGDVNENAVADDSAFDADFAGDRSDPLAFHTQEESGTPFNQAVTANVDIGPHHAAELDKPHVSAPKPETFNNPFANQASINLESADFEISGVDASQIDATDLDPFDLSGGDPFAPEDKENSQSKES